jgi:hypothetical protein
MNPYNPYGVIRGMGNAGQTPQYAGIGRSDYKYNLQEWHYSVHDRGNADFGAVSYVQGGYGGTLTNPQGYQSASQAYSDQAQTSMEEQYVTGAFRGGESGNTWRLNIMRRGLGAEWRSDAYSRLSCMKMLR